MKAGIIESSDYAWNKAVSRVQFCEFAYNMLSAVKELPVAKLSRNPFDDINNIKVNALAFVEIVSGKGEYRFAPEENITREEVAVILSRIAKYAELELPAVKVDLSYSDNDAISDWAVSSVYSLKVLNIVKNSEGEFFHPQDYDTTEEAVSSLLGLYRLLKKE